MDAEDRNSLLIGYLEGELDAAGRRTVEAWLAEDPALAAEFAEMRRLDESFSAIGSRAWGETGLDRLVLCPPPPGQRELAAEVLDVPQTATASGAVPAAAKPAGRTLELFENPQASSRGDESRSSFGRMFNRLLGGWGFAAAACLFLAASLFTWLMTGQQGEKHAASDQARQIAVVRQSTDPNLPKEFSILGGHVITVAEGARVQVQTLDGVVIWADAGTALSFDDTWNAHQSGGKTFVIVPASANMFTLHANGLTARTRDGRFEALPGHVAVRQGTVEASRGEGTASREARAGQALEATPEGTLRFSATDPEQIGKWTGEFVESPAPSGGPPGDQQSRTDSALPPGGAASFEEDPVTAARIQHLAGCLPRETNGLVVIQQPVNVLPLLLRLLIAAGDTPLGAALRAGEAEGAVGAEMVAWAGRALAMPIKGPVVIGFNSTDKSFTGLVEMANAEAILPRVTSALGLRPFDWLVRAERPIPVRSGRIPLRLARGYGVTESYAQTLSLNLLSDHVIVSNNDERRNSVRHALYQDLIGGLREEGRLDESRFFGDAMAARPAQADVFFALDLSAGVNRFMARKALYRDGLRVAGIDRWRMLTGSAGTQANRFAFDTFITTEAPARGLTELLGSGGGHPELARLPAECLGAAAFHVTSAQAVYDFWRGVLLEFEYDRDGIALQDAEDDFNRRAGFNFRESFVPLLGERGTLSLGQEAEGRYGCLLVIDSFDAVLAERMIVSAAERFGLEVRQAEFHGVLYHWANLDSAGYLPVFWRVEPGLLFAGIGEQTFMDQIAAQMAAGPSLANLRELAGGTGEAEFGALFVYLDFDRLYPALMSMGRSPSAARRWSSRGTQIPFFFCVQPMAGGLRIHGSASMEAEGFLSKTRDLIALPSSLEAGLRNRIRMSARNCETVNAWVREFHARRGRLPLVLAEIQQEGIGYPIYDLFPEIEQAPLHYQILGDDSWMVWSVGPDNTDGGGTVEFSEERGLQSGGDIVVRAKLE